MQDNKQDIVFRRKETDGQTGEELKSQTQQEGWRHEALEEEEVDLRDRWVEGDKGTDCISGRKKTDEVMNSSRNRSKRFVSSEVFVIQTY